MLYYQRFCFLFSVIVFQIRSNFIFIYKQQFVNRTTPVTLLSFLSFCKTIPTHTQTLRVNTTPTYTWVINLISLPSSAPRLSFCSAPQCVDLKYLLVSVFVCLYLVFFVIFISFWGGLSASDGFPSNRGVLYFFLSKGFLSFKKRDKMEL